MSGVFHPIREPIRDPRTGNYKNHQTVRKRGPGLRPMQGRNVTVTINGIAANTYCR